MVGAILALPCPMTSLCSAFSILPSSRSVCFVTAEMLRGKGFPRPQRRALGRFEAALTSLWRDRVVCPGIPPGWRHGHLSSRRPPWADLATRQCHGWSRVRLTPGPMLAAGSAAKPGSRVLGQDQLLLVASSMVRVIDDPRRKEVMGCRSSWIATTYPVSRQRT
jgi:hypothetical protein